MKGGDGEANYAHYALHRLKIRPGVLAGKSPLYPIDRREKAFIYASIDLHIENEKKQADKAKRKR
ncbi:hypothetical protein FDC64_08070 [Clostridium botulinum]|nr:hypothetical protein AGE31_17715 [Clostridium botulinum]NFL49257.1 hypothetical protein [Clostridium botulinum]NFM42479.1 hypothetical protein [Clostridium botulinum]NFM56687.1 hypothetical protein [Clostridium botulinum]NFP25543.1 hypothetical protein [Clostridium botulinum]